MNNLYETFTKEKDEEFIFSYYIYDEYLKSNKQFGNPRRYMQLLNNQKAEVVSSKLGYILYDGQIFGIIPQFCIKVKEERI